MTDQHGGVMNRLEQTRAAPLAKFWRAAAYEHHSARSSAGWARLTIKGASLGLCLLALAAAAEYGLTSFAPTASTGYPLADAAVAFAAKWYLALSQIPLMFAMAYAVKTCAQIMDEHLLEVDRA